VIYNAPIKDMMFLVDEWIGIENLSALPGFGDFDRDILEAVLEEAGKFCSTEILPINRDGDEVGAVFEDGTVTTPPGFKDAYQKLIGNGWTGIDADPDFGGQGLPKLLNFLIDEMLAATNLAFKLYAELSRGAYHLLATHASAEIRAKYLPKMVEGAWSGTMCLTEPHCGTDLGLLTTKAVPDGDGSFDISGTKIFITSGDHDLTENILHLVIARIDGAPQGSGGISLFLVPKFHVNDDGSVGDRNHVYTASIEHKMGIKGSATCVLNFDNAKGYLIGEENRGLAAMFRMMNIERLTVGIQGLGFAEIAYQNALAYAMERLQSRAPAPRPNEGKPADPIIFQPEIKRKLLAMRSQIEGGRALAVFAAYHADVMDKSADEQQREEAENTVALLTPVIKSFLSDLGVSSSQEALQVLGGHGYVREHGMEQLVRDSRITQIYEGTNEVQAADLVLRKLTGKTGQFADNLFGRWQQFLDQRKNNGDAKEYIEPTVAALARLKEATAWIRETDGAAARGAACNYQRLFALATIGCLWAQIMVSIRGKNGDFYETKRKTARFYMQQVLPETVALHEIVTRGSDALSTFAVADFDS
jgi:alkylation response protein AidB-like acyl-CoA dehydrogenase